MSDYVDETSENAKACKNVSLRKKTLVLACTVCIWLVLDRVTKIYFDSSGNSVGSIISGPYAGLIQFRLVHNQGAAWGIFSDSTFFLGILSLVLCAVILIFVWHERRALTCLDFCLLGLVLAGGIGNCIDRFMYGYVVDFIETAFMSFPVFNIADIGVTCGVILFVVMYLIRAFKPNLEK